MTLLRTLMRVFIPEKQPKDRFCLFLKEIPIGDDSGKPFSYATEGLAKAARQLWWETHGDAQILRGFCYLDLQVRRVKKEWLDRKWPK